MDPYGTIHPDWNPEQEIRFKSYVRGHEPNEESGWRYKLELVDLKYQDSDGFPISAIAGGNSWQGAFSHAATMVELALRNDHCIF